MAPRSTRPVATANKLVNVMTLDGEQLTNDNGATKPRFGSISYFPDGKQMVVGSTDVQVSARRWDLQTGEEIVEARFVYEQTVWAVAVSSDSRWVVTGGGNLGRDDLGELTAYEVDTRKMKTFEGHSHAVSCIDISADNKLLASGSVDDTARIWDLNNGKLVAGPFKCPGMVGAVRFSQDSKKLAVKSGFQNCLEVWDIQEQKLDGSMGKANGGIFFDTPVFWTTKDRTIVAAFTFEDKMNDPGKIYEFDPSTLETVGAPFEHAQAITSLALSFDCALLASASRDKTIKLWAFESRQLLASFDVHNPRILILSPNSRQLAYTTQDSAIHLCDIPLDILARIWPQQATRSTIAPEHSHPIDQLDSDATRHPLTVRRNPLTWSSPPPPIRPSRTIHPQQPSVLRYLRNIIHSSLHIDPVPVVRNNEARYPLDFPATSRPLPIDSAQAATQLRPTAAQSISLPPATTTTTTTRTRLRQLSNWWLIPGDHAPLPVVEVPLAQGKLRNAAAGAPKGNDGCVRDEEFDSRPPSPNSNPQQASAPAQTDTGEHGSGRLCFCL